MVGATVGMGDAVDCRLSLIGVGVTAGTAAGIGDGVDCESLPVEVAVTVGPVVGVGGGVGEGSGSLPHAASEKTAMRDDTTIAETGMRRMAVIAFDSRILSPWINSALPHVSTEDPARTSGIAYTPTLDDRRPQSRR